MERVVQIIEDRLKELETMRASNSIERVAVDFAIMDYKEILKKIVGVKNGKEK